LYLSVGDQEGGLKDHVPSNGSASSALLALGVRAARHWEVNEKSVRKKTAQKAF
jgi:hypothetical protein